MGNFRQIKYWLLHAADPEIELTFAAVPSVIAGRCGCLQDRHQLLRRKFTKIAALERVAGFAEEFDAAKRSAAQRIDGDGAAVADAVDSVADIGGQPAAIHRPHFGRGDPRQADAGGAMTPLAWPGRRPGFAQIGPVVALRIEA